MRRLMLLTFFLALLVLFTLNLPKADAKENAENLLLWSHQTDVSAGSVSISSDGSYIAAGTTFYLQNGKVYLFARESSKPLWECENFPVPYDDIFHVSISSDGNYIAAVADDGKLYLFHRSSNTPLWSSNLQYCDAFSVSISSDGSYIATGTGWNYGTVYLFSKENNVPLWSYQPGAGNIFSSISISSDSNYVVAGGFNPSNPWDLFGMIYLFTRSDNTPVWCYRTDVGIESVSVSSDGRYIVAGEESGKVYLFSNSSAQPLWSYDTGQWVSSVAISSDGSYIAVGGENGVYLFSTSSSTPLWSYRTNRKVSSVAVSSDGSYIATGSWDNKVYFFSRDSGTPLWSNEIGGEVESVSISSNGDYVAAGVEKCVPYWAPENAYGAVCLFSRAPVPSIAISPNTFSCIGGQSTTLTATLSSNGDPIEIKRLLGVQQQGIYRQQAELQVRMGKFLLFIQHLLIPGRLRLQHPLLVISDTFQLARTHPAPFISPSLLSSNLTEIRSRTPRFITVTQAIKLPIISAILITKAKLLFTRILAVRRFTSKPQTKNTLEALPSGQRGAK